VSEGMATANLPAEFGDYLVFADESGDHGLLTIDKEYPVFVLAFCVFKKSDYVEVVSPAIQSLKLKHFGHDGVVLHERDIRKETGDFKALFDRAKRTAFLNELHDMMVALPFTLISVVIRKDALKRKYAAPHNPYNVALFFGLERLMTLLGSQEQGTKLTHVTFERRGRREDEELELEFLRVRNANNWPLEMRFAEKSANLPGLQVADLVARPVGRHILDPKQANRAFEALIPKLFQQKGTYQGVGLKVFP
jgi:hypothetical protein